MKTTERLSFQVLAVIALAIFSIGAALSLLWLDSAHKAVPLQPAPVANRFEATAGKEDAAAAKLLQVKNHTVAQGETLSQIAQMYQIDVDTIYGANEQITELIYPGDRLVILPRAGVLHIVVDGDTIWSLSARYGIDIEAINTANQKTSDLIFAGETLFIPGGKRGRLENSPSRAAGPRFLWPAKGDLTSGYGTRWGRMHSGIDLAADTGAPVVSAKAGYVTYAGWLGSYGYAVILEHNQGYSTLYAHLSDYTVENGDLIATGALLGYVGSTGLSSGPHLHFEIHHQGVPVNPLNLLP